MLQEKPGRHFFRISGVILSGLLSVAAASAADTAPVMAAEQEAPGLVEEFDRYFSRGVGGGGVWEEDVGSRPTLKGVHLAAPVFEDGYAAEWYLEWKESRLQETLEAGLTVAFLLPQLERIGFGPRIKLGVQERQEQPHRGTDLVLGAGLEFGVWLSGRVYLVASTDRIRGLESRGRWTHAIGLRVMLWRD